jgi:hypothetical protein
MRKRVLPTCRPASIFVLLSLTFGSIIIFANPALRGPDEIAHFLRIYSYARGELLRVTEINGRKGIVVNPELYNQLYFFKTAGEVFARSREQGGMRYGQIMVAYSKLADTHADETEQASMFAPFAGTEGYNPVAYIPYIVAAAIGPLLRLDFPTMMLLMRFFGLLAFTAVAAYAIAVTPTLKWPFLLIAMLPVSLYNRAVLSADGAALSYTLAITAMCFSAAARGAQRFVRTIRPSMEAPLHVGPSISFPTGSMVGSERLGGQAVAGAHWHRGLAGHSASALDLSRADYSPPTRAISKTAAGRSSSHAGHAYRWPCCPGGRRPRVSDLFSRLHANRHRPCPGGPRTVFRYRTSGGCGIHCGAG